MIDTRELEAAIKASPSADEMVKEYAEKVRRLRRELEAAQENLKNARTSEVKNRRSREQELIQQWKLWLARQYGRDLPASILEKIYNRAWEDGHSSGYQEVADYYEEYADFAYEARHAD